MRSVVQNQPMRPSARKELRANQNQPMRPPAPRRGGPVQNQPMRPPARRVCKKRKHEREKRVMLCETESLGLRFGRGEEADALGQKKQGVSRIENHREMSN